MSVECLVIKGPKKKVTVVKGDRKLREVPNALLESDFRGLVIPALLVQAELTGHPLNANVSDPSLPRKKGQPPAAQLWKCQTCGLHFPPDGWNQSDPIRNAFDPEWQRTDCQDKGAELSFQGAELQRPPWKMEQEGSTDGGATSAPHLMAPTGISTPDSIEACDGDKVDTFDRDSRRGDTSPPTNWSDPDKQQTHRQPDKHPCRFCPHSSPYAADVVIHERTHTGERPFSCGACKKTFARKSRLMAHNRIHTGEKPFKCNTCSKAFAQKCSLANHERTHTGEKPYRCETCSRAFAAYGNLYNHRKTHRKQSEPSRAS